MSELPRSDCDVSVVIPNWNRSDLLLECLRSIAKSTHRVMCDVTVVDNASTDDSVRRMRDEFPQVKMIVNETNRGFAAACNQGLRAGVGRLALLFNNDARMMDGCLDEMVAFMDAHPHTGALTCKQLDASTMQTMPPCANAFPSPKNLLMTRLVHLLRLPQRFPQGGWWRRWTYLADDPDSEHKAAHITGACFMIRREAIEHVGLLDEGYTMYLEETDWCMRLRNAGWEIHYTPRAAFVHHLSASGQLRSDREELYYRSYCRFFEKHYGKLARWIYQIEKGFFNLLKRAGT